MPIGDAALNRQGLTKVYLVVELNTDGSIRKIKKAFPDIDMARGFMIAWEAFIDSDCDIVEIEVSN